MNAAERIKRILETGQVDRVPVSGWMHLPLLDRNAEKFANALIHETDDARFDFLKVMSNAYCMAEAYGAGIDFSDDATKWQRSFFSYPIVDAETLSRIPVLGAENSVFQREKRLIQLLNQHYGGTMPIIATVFSPVTWLKYMADQSVCSVQYFMENYKSELHKFCEHIFESICNQLDMLAGIDGIFLASQYCSKDSIEKKLFEEFCVPYEKAILDHVKSKTWFNILHIHGTQDLYFKEILDYDVQALNWENCPQGRRCGEGIMSLTEAHQITDKILICGVDREKDFQGTYEQVANRMAQRLNESLKECNGERFIFCPGCGIPVGTEMEKLKAMAEAVDRVAG